MDTSAPACAKAILDGAPVEEGSGVTEVRRPRHYESDLRPPPPARCRKQLGADHVQPGDHREGASKRPEDIKTTLEQAGIGLSKFGSSYLNAQNKLQPCYLLPRFECDLVVSGYSVPYRLAIIKRWHELEAKEAPTFALVVKDGERGVDLRELHRELQSGKDFSNWEKSRLVDLQKGYDFEVLLAQTGEQTGRGGHNRVDYLVTIECAKHIAMMERTDRGRQVRQYFIDFEKAVRERDAAKPTTPALPQNYAQALRLAADLADRNEEQARLLEAQQPAVGFYEKLVGADGLYGVRDTGSCSPGVCPGVS